MVSDSLAEAKELTSGWGWFLAAGIAWVIFGFVVLSFNMATVWAIAVFFGIGFIVGGVMEFAVAAGRAGVEVALHPDRHRVDRGRDHGVGVAGADLPRACRDHRLAAPGLRPHRHRLRDRTCRGVDDLWWLGLVGGIVAVLIGLWAISPDDATVASWRGTVLLVFWVGAAALIRGISDIVLGFRLRSAHENVSRLA